MCVWLFSLPSWRNIDGDRCKRAETHTDDLKSNEVADTFHQLGPLQPAAIHADESKFLSHAILPRRVAVSVGKLWNKLCEWRMIPRPKE